MLDARKSAILQALVEEHVRTGEPVSSTAILEASGLSVSSATIRNELVRLESEGFVAQPHTSAGRIPTDKTYRFYVDHLSPTRTLRTGTKDRIEDFFTTVQLELGRMLQKTSDLLADITHYPAVVLGPGMSSDVIHDVNLVRLGRELVLVVLVAESGVVAKDMARVRRPVTVEEIALAEQLLVDVFRGRTISDAVAAIADRGLASMGDPVREVVDVAARVAMRSEESIKDIYVGGTSQLASLWADLSKVHRLLEFLEREAALQALLWQEEEGISVRIGAELDLADDDDLAVVSSSYAIGTGGRGRIGVLGPKRMDYRRTIEVVEEVSEGLGDTLGG